MCEYKWPESLVDGDGDTPLHFAAAAGRWKLVVNYINLGGDVNVKNNLGWTPLMHAVRNGHLKMVNILIHLGADIGHSNDYGTDSLSIAAAVGNLDIIRLLLKKRLQRTTHICDDKQFVSPLSVAVLFNKIDVIRLLTARRFQIDSKTRLGGLTPLEIATATENKKVMDLLRRRGARKAMTNEGSSTSVNNIPGNIQLCLPTIKISGDISPQNNPQHPVNFLDVLYNKNIRKCSNLSIFSDVSSPNLSPIATVNSPAACFPHYSKSSIDGDENMTGDILKVVNVYQGQVKRNTTNRSRSQCVPLISPNPTEEEYTDDVFEATVDNSHEYNVGQNYKKNRYFSELLRKNSLDSCMSLFQKHEIDLDVFLTLSHHDLNEIGIDWDKRAIVLELIYQIKKDMPGSKF